MQDDDHAIRELAVSLQAQAPMAMTPVNVDRIRAMMSVALGAAADQSDVSVGPYRDGAISVSVTPKKSPEERAAIERRTHEIADDIQRLSRVFAQSQASASKA